MEYGYDCFCGAGFQWNSKACVSIALNSRLEFDVDAVPSPYSTVLGKPYRNMTELTVAFWIRLRVDSPLEDWPILSYSTR